METLAEPQIGKVGKVGIQTDDAEGLFRGSATMRLIPEGQPPLHFIPVPTREDALALKTVAEALQTVTGDGAEEFRAWVTDQIGYEVDWQEISERYDRAFSQF